MGLFKLEKLKIHVFKTRKRTTKVKTFIVMFNPETYSLKYQNKFQGFQGINTSEREAQYALSKPGTLSLKLILDNSGVTEMGLFSLFSSDKDVYKKVQEFLDLTFHMDGDIHEPKYLKIEWGDLIYSCRLESVNVTYSMFDRNGKPVRAELDTQFVGDIEDSKRVKKENKNSPDLSHVRVVKEGDTLPLMTESIYGNSSLYIRVAEYNKLDNFRELVPGMEILFPPIEK